ncbi:MobF family relaxase [Nocardia sp. CDC160]|uniref:MobF family relaxase n=1 Tax=Nocardia sp. CDC160 TaxID=3112166 RepID=UPI002DB83D23|nr:MobF family relaxase [Nocardia sp. CDC160]MEC3919295.1 MobF family relaxase [Nocardia sp. CDC160]
MTATVHKLSAGDGFEYYLRQTAAHDVSERGRSSLSDYYSVKGESPGVWMGSGLSEFDSIAAGDAVTESQMRALFGLGRHPDAEAIEDRVFAERLEAGAKREDARRDALAASQLGQPFRIFTGASEFRRRCAEEFTAYNLALGERWNAPIPDEVRAEVRTRIARELFAAEFDRAPLNDRELSGWVARNSRSATTAVAGFDVCFSPVKSISALWAIAPRPIAEKIERAHRMAVADALAYLEAHAAYTRLGANGVAQVDTCGLVATAFEHRDSRAGDPDLHTHLVISAKVRTREGKLWRALDGRMVYRVLVTASEIYNTRSEHYVNSLVGAEFADRGDADPDRPPIREIVGIAEELRTLWSRRDTAIEACLAELARRFHTEWGREPTTVEMLKLSERATLDTRPAKHESRSPAEQRAAWWTEAVELLGGEAAVADMIWNACHPRPVPRDEISPEWIAGVADRVIDVVSRKRSVWQATHVRSEVERQIRGQVSAQDWARAAEAVTREALSASRSIARTQPDRLDEPQLLRRVDGTSVYTVAESQQYTSSAVLTAEHRLVAAAQTNGGRTIFDSAVDIALLEFTANNNGRELNAGQVALVREFATSGRRLQVAIAPAGTGKTVAMQVLVRAWRGEGGNALGLAPTAASAAVLEAEIGTGVPVVTIDKLGYVLTHLTPKTAGQMHVPAWVRTIGPGTLVIIDEAAKASTRQLDLVVDFLLRRGAIVRAIGDDRQLASITAGGVLRDIADLAGAVSLTRVMRFHDPAEAAATLAVRAGDPSVIAFYADRNRLHIGVLDRVIDACYTAWAADRAAGLDAVMLAPTREIVAILNERARRDRLAQTTKAVGPELELADGLRASKGDLICTRRNNPRLRISATDYVRNGYRWRVLEVRADGTILAAHLDSGRRVLLPPAYVREEVTLGWATTIDSAQGITADTGHSVVTGTETRAQLYVAISRGRRRNDIYAQTAVDLAHELHSERATHPPTVVDILIEILTRDPSERSATTSHRETFAVTTRLGHAADAYAHAVGAAAEHLAGPETMSRIETAAERLYPGLVNCGGWPALRQHLAIIAITPDENGQPGDPMQRLASAIAERDFDGVRDAAAVLDWRLSESDSGTGGSGPLPWLIGIPDVLRNNVEFGPYLVARARLVADLAAETKRQTERWTPASAPAWSRPLQVRQRATSATRSSLLGDVAVWRAVRRIDDADHRFSGPPLPDFGPARRYQRLLDKRVTVEIGDHPDALGRWVLTVDAIDPRIAADSFWPALAARLDLAHRAGIDVPTLLRGASDAGPLPDEQPAAALWWRIAGELDLAVLEADFRNTDPLRPEWITDVEDVLGVPLAAFVQADPAWPRLVAAIESADPTRWTPRTLLETAGELLREACTDDDRPRPDHYATALAWRITALTRHHLDLHRSHSKLSEEPPPHPDEDAEYAAAHGYPPEPEHPPVTFADRPGTHIVELPSDADADYLASLQTLIPPGDPPVAEAGGPLEYTVEGEDDASWRPSVDPATIPDHRDLPPIERARVLRAEHDDYARVYRDLYIAYHRGAGRHLRAVQPHLERLRALRDAQRPYLLAARDAHAEWIAAEQDAATYRARVEDLSTHIPSKVRNTELDDLELLLTAIPDHAARATFVVQIAELHAQSQIDSDVLDLYLARICADSATQAAERAKTHADNTFRELVEAAGPTGIVTAADVETARLTADDLDLAELNQARFRYQWKLAQLHRIGLEPIAPLDLGRSESRTFRADTHATSAPVWKASPASDRDLRHLTDVELGEQIRQLCMRLALESASNAVLMRWTRTDSSDFDRRLQQHRLTTETERHREDLAAAQAEHQRREALPADLRSAEDQARMRAPNRRCEPTKSNQDPVGLESFTAITTEENAEHLDGP